jgi:2-haloacid dehalogenase
MLDRRKFLLAAGAGAATISTSQVDPALAQQSKDNQREMKPEVANVKALVFDTFGTVVDWRSSVIAEGMIWGKAKGLNRESFLDSRLASPQALA